MGDNLLIRVGRIINIVLGISPSLVSRTHGSHRYRRDLVIVKIFPVNRGRPGSRRKRTTRTIDIVHFAGTFIVFGDVGFIVVRRIGLQGTDSYGERPALIGRPIQTNFRVKVIRIRTINESSIMNCSCCSREGTQQGCPC